MLDPNEVTQTKPDTTVSRYLERVLERRDTLRAEEREILRSLPVERVSYGDGETIIQEGPAPDRSCLLIAGMATRVHRIGRHDRITSALHVPGDFVDLHAFLLRDIDHDIVAHGDCQVEFVSHEALEELSRTQPHLTRLLWMCTLIDAKLHRIWIATRARLRAADRIGHLFCELNARLEVVGLATGGRFDFPFDQRALANILGYSAVHLNRAVQDLRAAGLLVWDRRKIHLPDPSKLATEVGFKPSYLEIGSHPR